MKKNNQSWSWKPEVNSIYESSNKTTVPGLKILTPRLSDGEWIPKLSRWINKYLYNLGMGAAFNKYERSFALYSAGKDKTLYKQYNADDIFCNFGSGSFYHKRWKNFDFEGQTKSYKALQGKKYIDYTPIDLNINNITLPFEDNSVSLIYFSHTIEHLEEEKAVNFIAECHRILKSGAVLRIVIPSTDQHMRILSIIDQQEILTDHNIIKLSKEVARHVLTDGTSLGDEKLVELVRRVEYDPRGLVEELIKLNGIPLFEANSPGRHISFWDYEKIVKVGSRLGFSACIPCYRGGSIREPFTNTLVFDNSEAQFSQYIELVK